MIPATTSSPTSISNSFSTDNLATCEKHKRVSNLITLFIIDANCESAESALADSTNVTVSVGSV